MLIRFCKLLFLSIMSMMPCLPGFTATQAEHDFGPEHIILYAEVVEATHGWLGDAPVLADIRAVDYDYSAGFDGLYKALNEAIDANERGRCKAVKALVTWRQVKAHGGVIIQILSSKDIQIVDFPAELYEIWEASVLPPFMWEMPVRLSTCKRMFGTIR